MFRPPHRLLLAVALLFLSPMLRAQDPPIEWGNVPRSDLEFTSYPADSNASAVILCDYGTSTMDDDMNLVYFHHRRIKILTAKGFDWGTHEVSVASDRDVEYIDDIKGATYTLKADGTVETKELQDDGIFEENVTENFKRYKLALPGLTPGCVIEYRYRIVASSWWRVRDWRFQLTEPVRWSEYRFATPVQIGFAVVVSGYEPFIVNEKKDETQYVSGSLSAYLHENLPTWSKRRWAVKNAPAIREEPFMTTAGDYINRLDIQLAGYAVPGGVRRILSDWPTVIGTLVDSKYFGKQLDVTRTVRKRTDELTAGLTSPEAKLRAIYNWVDTTIVFSHRSLSASQDVDEVMESRTGNSAEITFLLLSMLQHAGIKGEPVIVSTRSHGLVQQLYPMLAQFNHTLARVWLGDTPLFVDATDPARELLLLSPEDMNVQGLVIQPDREEWVTIQGRGSATENVVATMALEEDGTAVGTLDGRVEGFSALNARRTIKDTKEVDLAHRVLSTDAALLALDSLSFTGLDSVGAPIRVKARYAAAGLATMAGDRIYVNPHIAHQLKTSPLTLAERKYPVDYGYPRSWTVTVNLRIPDGYELAEPLRERRFSVGQDDATFWRLCGGDSTHLQIRMALNIRKPVFKAASYQNLRDLYALIVSVTADQVVLQKKPTPPPAPAAPAAPAKAAKTAKAAKSAKRSK